MLISFLGGTVFGAVLMFMARLADKDVSRVVERYKATGILKTTRPIILDPNEVDKDKQLIDEILEGQKE